MINIDLMHAPLGKQTANISEYQPDLLFPIERKLKRDEIGVHQPLPFQGFDIWNGYELSWLNAKGKPIVAAAEFIFPCETPKLIESKSFKLYLNSFNNSRFNSFEIVQDLLKNDLSKAVNANVIVNLMPLSALKKELITHLPGTSLDDLDITCDTYTTNTEYLITENQQVSETLYSDLLKSNCLVTGQPDWASVHISYSGKKIQHEGLLKYFVSFRNHDEFHEQCVERIFMDITKACQPEKLCVYARYTRRGGLDINPYRANYPINIQNVRLVRQ